MARRGYLLVGGVAAVLSLLTTSVVRADSEPAVNRPAFPGPTIITTTTAAAVAIEPRHRQTSAPMTLAAGPVRVTPSGFFAWALLDRRTGKIAGRNMTATNSTESMIKIWIVADFLRRAADRHEQPTERRLAQARAAIRDSDDDAAQSLYVAGGRDAVVSRMIQICALTDTRIAGPLGVSDRGWWSYTRISARDAVRLGECVKNGTAAGSRWTAWVLEQMSKVRGSAAPKDQQARRGGRWGIIDGLPDAIRSREPIAIKNGWTLINADQKWHLNCLAVADDWVLAVLMRYPGKLGLMYGAKVCRSVAAQLVTARSATDQPAAATVRRR